MGSRNYRRRETKKAKKGAKKPAVVTILQTPGSVETIKKGKKEKPETPEE